MNFQELFKIIPKQTLEWSKEDTQKWLRLIQLEGLREQFGKYNDYMFCMINVLEKMNIDGSVLLELDQNDFQNEMSVNSNIMVKKLVNWVQKILPQYNEYIEKFYESSEQYSSVVQQFQNSNLDTDQQEMKRFRTAMQIKSKFKRLKKAEFSEQKDEQDHENQAIQIRDKENGDCSKIKKLLKDNLCILRATNMDNNSKTLHLIEWTGDQVQNINIGRSVDSNVYIHYEDVSRKQCTLCFKDGKFMLKDNNSLLGTYIKVKENVCYLKNEMQFEIGEQVIEVQNIKQNSKKYTLSFRNTTSGDSYQIRMDPDSTKFKRYTIGRKQECNFIYSRDQHLSNVHCCLAADSNGIYIEDLKSTNGTWLKCKPECWYELKDGNEFRIASEVIFQLLEMENKQEQEEQFDHEMMGLVCVICCEKQRDTMMYPCRHLLSCMGCSKRLNECPVCKATISDYIRVFHS